MGNPVLSQSRWDELARGDAAGAPMTVAGTMTKAGILLGILLTVLVWMWIGFWNQGHPQPQRFMPFFIGGALGGLICCLLGSWVPRIAAPMALLYAVAEGLFLGGLTMLIEATHPGLPLLAATLTTGTLLGMLALYRTGIIVASPGFVRGVVGATIGLALGYAALALLGLFGIGHGVIGTLRGSGPIGIGFSLLCVGLAALNLVVDFAFIEGGARARLPQRMEWVGALGLLVTLVWLYVEILRLLGKARGRS